jgi:PIN domain nuclease of toxin-antitoxin system
LPESRDEARDSYLLLDTSTILWALASPEKLSAPARRILDDEDRSIVLSVASYWEIMVKSNRRQLNVGNPVLWWQQASAQLKAQTLSIRQNHVSALLELPEYHRDPFDRMLIAQAKADDLTILTSDIAIHRYPIAVKW